MRVITNSEDIVYVGLDLNGRGPALSIKKIKTPKQPFLQTLLGLTYDKKSKEIQDLLSEVHYSFPSTESMYGYLSKFILGQSLIIDKVNKKDVKSKGVFKHENNKDLDTFFFQVEENLLVFNINYKDENRAQTRRKSANEGILPIDQIKKQGTEIKNVVEVNVSGAYGSKAQFSPGQHFHSEGKVKVQSYALQEYLSKKVNAKGHQYNINSDVDNLKEKFKIAVNYQHKKLGKLIGGNSPGVKEVDMGEYKRLFNAISEAIYNNRVYFFDALKGKEYQDKALFDGILTGLSDINSDELRVLVPTEFQVGKGKRVDLAIQTIGKDAKQGIPILVELKKDIKKGSKDFLDAEKQLTEYLKSPNIKSITDGKQAAGFVVALSTKLKGVNAENTIQISDKLTVSPVMHSSIIDSHIPSSSKSSSSQKLCFSGKNSRGKREASFRNCISISLTKKEIQEISKGKGIRFNIDGADIEIDREKFEVDSEEFIKLFEGPIRDEKYEDMIKLSNNVEITGNFKNQVKGLITKQKIINGLEKIGKTAGIGNYVILGKDVLSNIANGNYDRVVVSAGMLAGQHGLGKLSKHVAAKGAKLIKSGSKILGTSITLSSSFIPNAFTMPLDIKNLIDSIEGCEKGDHDSCVGVAENSIYIAEGVVETGVMVGIATGAISSSGTVASIVFPVGTAVVVVTAIGSQVYIAVHRANEIDKVMPLTTGEWWNEAWRSFTFREVSEDVTKLMREKEFNNQVVADVVEWLKSNKNFQSIVVPSMGVRIDRKEVFQGCDFIEKVFFNSLFYPNAGCKSLANNPGYYKRIERIVYVPEIKQDNSASFDQKVKVMWSRTAPDFPTEGSVMCAPEGEGGRVLDEGYRCKDAIAVEYTHSRTGDDAIFKLLDGNDETSGFRDRKNVFIINNGHKTITGGNNSDDFVFLGSSTTGIIRGLNGDNAVFMEGFISGNERLFAYFEEEKSNLLYSSPNVQNPRLEVEMYNINRFYGRSDRPDRAIIVCRNNINTIDLLGGGRKDVMLNTSSSELWDEIYIAENSNKVCSYKLNLAIHRYTSVISKTSGGEFFYLVKPIDKHRSYGGVSRMELHGSSVHNIFFEESRLFDIDVISFDRSGGIYNITVKFYVMSRSKGDVIYRHTNHTINNWSECEVGHFCLNIQSQSIENLKLMLSDGTSLNLEEKRLYITYPIEIRDVTSKYSRVARELGWSVFAKSNTNRCVSIGNGDNNLLYNKVEGCVNYLVGNGGNNTYVIISGYNKLNPDTKIPNIIIDRVDSGEQTLILSDLISQIRKDLHTKVISLIHKDNDDLLFKIRLSGYHFDLLEIRMQGALINDSYKRWKVVLNDIPMKLIRYGNVARLGILPLVYTNHDSDIVDILKNAKKIYSEDLQDTKELNVSDRGIGNYGFVRNGNDLILSNLFNSKEGQNYAIVFVNFYLLEEQFIDATIVFSDGKSISIQDRVSEVHDARNIIKQLKDSSYNGFSLHQASKENDLDEVTFLLGEGASVDFRDDNGLTPLHYAAALGNLAVVKKLVEKGADFNAQYFTERRTPLHEAAYYNKMDIVKFLVSAGADVNIQDKHGITPLRIAAAEGNYGIVEYLRQEVGVDLKSPNTVEKPLQRKHRHHHGDHDYHHIHLSRKPLSIEQPEVVASSGTRPSSWINGLFGWITSSIGGLLGSNTNSHY
ncbi:ankyrin repeat domain-containing protein [Wolbachia endosymbiont of Tetranychus urticae]|uniref:ankyrin repeat domain-containing protein n=1 Tax=Wolbachia endosymbiont of Tetranychus urticae TaxID=169184 RepID=UPI00397AF5A6